jgi:hypothetical protein
MKDKLTLLTGSKEVVERLMEAIETIWTGELPNVVVSFKPELAEQQGEFDFEDLNYEPHGEGASPFRGLDSERVAGVPRSARAYPAAWPESE